MNIKQVRPSNHRKRRLARVLAPLFAALALMALNASPAFAATRDIHVSFTNNSDSALTLTDQNLNAGCWNPGSPPTDIPIGATVEIASGSCGFATGTEFRLTYKLELTGTSLKLHYDNPFGGDDTFEETAPQGYAFSKSGVIEDRSDTFGCSSTTCDGIPDAWKTGGMTIDPGGGNPPQFVDLPKMGLALDRPNVLVQLDSMVDPGAAPAHDQTLRQAAIDTVIRAFDQEPQLRHGATRPGVTLIVDAGPNNTITPGGAKWGALSRAVQVPWTKDFLTADGKGGYDLTNFYAQLKKDFVPTGRLPIFHHTIAAAEIASGDSTSGPTSGDLLGFMVTLGDWTGGVGSQDEQAGTFMHELGHTLGLDHSGGEGNANNVNFKPNYPSVMNYSYQTGGVIKNDGTRVFDYSRQADPVLDETKLTEAGGVFLDSNPNKYGATHTCMVKNAKGVLGPQRLAQKDLAPVDWNCDGTVPNGATGFDSNGDLAQTTLKGSPADWLVLQFKTGGVGAGAGAKDTVAIPDTGVTGPVNELTLETDRQIRELPLSAALTYNGATTADYHHTATMSAALLDPGNGNAPISNRMVTFRIGAGVTDTCTATTDATGKAACDIRMTQTPGVYPLGVTFGGDAMYKPASDTTHSFTINRARTALTYAGATTADYHHTATMSATLVEADDVNTVVPGRSVTFRIGTSTADTCAATTDATGKAACDIRMTQAAGVYPIPVTFDGDAVYQPSSDASHSFTVTKARTSLAYNGDLKLANGTPANLAATLTEEGIAPIAGRTVTLTAGSGSTQQACTATTDASGVARCAIPVLNQPLNADGTVPLAATFASDPFYLASNASATGKLTYMTGRSYGLSADALLPIVPLHLPAQPDTGAIRTAAASTTAPPCSTTLTGLLVSARGLCPNVTVTLAPGKSVGTTTVQDATIGIPGVPVIKLTAIRSVSTSTCSAATGSVTISGLTIGGKAVNTATIAPNSGIDLGSVGKLILDEQLPVPGADYGLTVNALHLTALAGTVDVVIGSSTSDIHNC